MSPLINKLRPARQDLVDIFYYYASRGTIRTARRFLAQAEATLQRLARMPGIGTRYEPDEPLYAEMHFFPSPDSACSWSFTGLCPPGSKCCACGTGRATSRASCPRNSALRKMMTTRGTRRLQR